MLVSSPTLEMFIWGGLPNTSGIINGKWVPICLCSQSCNAILYPVLHAWALQRFTGRTWHIHILYNCVPLMQNWQCNTTTTTTTRRTRRTQHARQRPSHSTWSGATLPAIMERIFHIATNSWSERPMLPTKTSPVWMPQRMEILSSNNKSSVSPHTVLEIVKSQRVIPKNWWKNVCKSRWQTPASQPLIDSSHCCKHLRLANDKDGNLETEIPFFGNRNTPETERILGIKHVKTTAAITATVACLSFTTGAP